MNALVLFSIFSGWPALCAALGAWAGYRTAPHEPLPVACRRSAWGAIFALLSLAAGLLVWAYALNAGRPPGPPERDANPISFGTFILALILVAFLTALLAPLAGMAAYRGVAFGHTLTHELGGILGGALGAGLVLPLGLAVILFLRTTAGRVCLALGALGLAAG
ncbi:MAG: hypothetical protein KC910_21570 [Candidatus Eremiobacteraeota bacterium]|nr:hypothetical protein [Candidatus Eremiobacteraeota bacterium]